MRTTLDLEEDVLLAAKEIARQRGVSLGKVFSELARQALSGSSAVSVRNGVPLFPVREQSGIATLELINRLRDDVP
ncbi:MAG: CopG family transcriptional regulator [Aphanocapsa lilacina HA4352-LM1]|jgi:hypothetical protein|nr:CopG family transcriptional regulator [Aphanocapsa lilacina HA4352-LM1]